MREGGGVEFNDSTERGRTAVNMNTDQCKEDRPLVKALDVVGPRYPVSVRRTTTCNVNSAQT